MKRARAVLTPKQRVLKLWPKARCVFGFRSHNGAGWSVRADGFSPLSGWFLSPRQAWNNAASYIPAAATRQARKNRRVSK